jgi:hypothetical protein
MLTKGGCIGPPVFNGATSYGLKMTMSGLDYGAVITLNFCCSSSIIKSKGLRNLSPVLPEVRTHSQKQNQKGITSVLDSLSNIHNLLRLFF